METNENQRKIVAVGIIAIGIVVIVIILLLALNKNKGNNNENQVDTSNYTEQEDGTKVNTSDKILKIKQIGDIQIENANLVYKNSESVLTINVVNKGEVQNNLRLKIKYIGIDGSTILESTGYVGKILKEETKQITVQVTTDIANIEDIEYEILT